MAVIILLFIIISVITIGASFPLAKYTCSLTNPAPIHKYELLLKIPYRKQTADQFFLSLMLCNAASLIFCLCILLTQYYLPFNPQKLIAVDLDLAINIAVSFVTGTNWQTYSGEQVLSYTSQLALTFVSFIAAASAISIALMLLKGLTVETHGNKNNVFQNFWQILFRLVVYLLIPLCVIFSLLLVSEGTIQNFSKYTRVITLEDAEYILPQGPVAIFKSIALLGVSGGGFFGTNSLHPFENPTQTSNIIQIIMMCLLPTTLILCYGIQLKRPHHGLALLTFLYLLLLGSNLWLYNLESSYKLADTLENLEGKELRFGTIGSMLYTAYASLSCGGMNTAYNNVSPASISLITTNVITGSFVMGSTGTGLMNLLIFILLAVFFSGMMAGRIPQFLGKKIDSGEIKYIMLYVAAYQSVIIAFIAISLNHIINFNLGSSTSELTRVLMMNTSTIVNNGTGFPSDYMSSEFMNNITSIGMLFGRYILFYCMIKTAASLATKKIALNRVYEIQTDSPFFFILMLLVITNDFLVFIPIIILGPLMNLLTGI